jgi:hypothetical protein
MVYWIFFCYGGNYLHGQIVIRLDLFYVAIYKFSHANTVDQSINIKNKCIKIYNKVQY